MDVKRYFKRSDYARLWPKAVLERASLAKVAGDYLKMINSLPGKCLLDIGVGEGRFILSCARTGLKYYVGLDVSKEMLLRAKSRYLSGEYESTIFLVQGDAEHLPFRNEMFDKIICIATSWYLPNLNSFVSEISRVSKSKCAFFGDFMNYSNRNISLQRTVRALANSILRHIRRLQSLRKMLLHVGVMLDRFPRKRLWGLDKDWVASFFTWGVTPFLPAFFSDVIFLFQLHSMEIKKVVGDEFAPLIYIVANKRDTWTEEEQELTQPPVIVLRAVAKRFLNFSDQSIPNKA